VALSTIKPTKTKYWCRPQFTYQMMFVSFNNIAGATSRDTLKAKTNQKTLTALENKYGL